MTDPATIRAETWRPIPGYEGRYDVSDQGRIRSWLSHHGVPGPRIRQTRVRGGGNPHPQITLRDADQNWRSWQVHALVLLAFVGPRPDGLEIRHLDDNPEHNHLSNLAYGTRSENRHDRVRNGRDHNARKTHCPQGHEYTPDNIDYELGKYSRHCRTCRNARNKAQGPRRRSA